MKYLLILLRGELKCWLQQPFNEAWAEKFESFIWTKVYVVYKVNSYEKLQNVLCLERFLNYFFYNVWIIINVADQTQK